MSRLASFLDLMRAHASLACVEDDARTYTYAQLLTETENWQRRFDELEVSPGKVVGLRADHSLATIAALLALFERGAIAALIPEDRDPTSYLQDACVSTFLEFARDGSSCRRRSVPHAGNHTLLDELRARSEGGIVIFTSGSTGRPKAALQSVERFLYKFQRPGRRFRTLAFLLFDHVAGMDTVFYTLASGGTLILTRTRDPRSILKLIESHRVEVLPTSPSFLRMVCAGVDCGAFELSSLQIITYGSEPMDPSTLGRLNALFPAAQIVQKYGTTETGSPRTKSRGNDSLWLRIKSESVETKVVDDILWIRSEGTILGYLNAPSPIDYDGWYCTGDVVDVDGDWVRFRGRASDVINVGGQKVAPAQVEETILELDFVRDVVVCGEPHTLLGFVVTARATLATNAVEPRAAVKRIRAHCRQRLAAYKVPVKIDIVAGQLTNSRQKAQRMRAADPT